MGIAFSSTTTILLYWSGTLGIPSASLINGPYPMNAVAPLGATVTFTCVVNRTKLPFPLLAIVWRVDGVHVPGSTDVQQDVTNGSLEISVLHFS